MNKRYLALLLAVLMMISVLAGCGKKSEDTSDGETTQVTSNTAAADEQTDNSVLGQADQAAAAAGEQQPADMEDTTGTIETIQLQDTIEDSDGGKEGLYSIHLKETANWGSGTEQDTQTALTVIKEVMEQSRNDGYGSCVVYAYQANNCMAFMWFEFNAQYLSLFDKDGNTSEVVALTDEQVTSVGAAIPEF